MKKILILLMIIILSSGQCFASELKDILVGGNSETANQGERPIANLATNIDNGSTSIWDRIPGQTGDGSSICMGEVPADQTGTVTGNTVAATLSFDAQAFVDSNGNFDQAAYTALRLQLASYMIDHPGASVSDINSYVNSLNPHVNYQEGTVTVTQDGSVVINFDPPVTFKIVSLLGTGEGGITVTDLANSFNQSVYDGLETNAEKLAYLLSLLQEAVGLNDLMASLDWGEDDPDTPVIKSGKVWGVPSGRHYNYTDLETGGKVEISSEKYNVEKAIPTSENLDFEAKEVDDILYDVKVNTSLFWAGCEDIPIYQTCTFDYFVPHQDAVYGTYTEGEHSGEQYLISPEVEAHFEHNGIAVSSDYFDLVSEENWASCYSVSPSIYQADYALVSNAPTTGDVQVPFNKETLNYNSFSSSFVGAHKPNVQETEYVNVGHVGEDTSKEFAAAYAEAKGIADSKNAGKVAEKRAEIIAAVHAVPEGTKSTVTRGTKAEFDFRNEDGKGFDITPGKDATSKQLDVVKQINSQVKTEMIPETKLNGNYSPSAVLYYTNYSEHPEIDVNDVFVHTPVTDEAYLESEAIVDQRVTKIHDQAIQLDSGFRIIFPNEGTHINEDGYKTRDYISNQAVPGKVTNWGYVKDMKFSFDVYLRYKTESSEVEKTIFIPKGQWVGDIVPDDFWTVGFMASMEYYFLVPVWAPEGEQFITTEVISENGYRNGKTADEFMQEKANKDSNKYIATKVIPVEIIGKIYDLQVNNSTDVRWLDQVQNMDTRYNLNYVPANELPFGNTQAKPGFRSQNKNASYKYAPKLGYTFSFNFKTKGRKSDSIKINVSDSGFYFVSKGSGTVSPVDLYYIPAGSDSYKKLETTGDASKITISYRQDNTFLKIPGIEMTDSTRIYNYEKGKAYNYDTRINAGRLSKLLLPNDLRLTFNNMKEYITDGGRGLYKQTRADIIQHAKNSGKNNEPGEDVVTGSVGRWYVGYKLPASTIAVDRTKASGYNASTLQGALKNKQQGLVLQDGYILVTMDIVSNDESNNEYLRYDGPKALNLNADGGIEEDPSTPTDPDWTQPYDPSKEDNYNEINLPDIPNPIKVPNDVIAVFETLDAKDDNTLGLEA